MMVDDYISRINSVTPYYCRDGHICGGRCRFRPCPAGDPWALSQMPFGERFPWWGVKPRIRVKAGSRKVSA